MSVLVSEITAETIAQKPPHRQLKIWLAHEGMTAEQLAAQLGVTGATLSQVTRGKGSAMDLLARLTEVTGIEWEE